MAVSRPHQLTPPAAPAHAQAQRPGTGFGHLLAAHPVRAAFAALLVIAAVVLAARALPEPGWLLAQQAQLLALRSAAPWSFGAAFFCLFTLMAALALPGCGLLALGAGLCFGLVQGTALVLLASTAGATVSFLAARHLWRDALQRRWGHRLAAVEAGLARDGAFYLFSLRVAPIIPFGLVNPLMGLSPMPLRQFFGISLLGMLAGSVAYVYAGTVLVTAQGWSDLLSPTLLAMLGALALLPWGLRAAWRVRTQRQVQA